MHHFHLMKVQIENTKIKLGQNKRTTAEKVNEKHKMYQKKNQGLKSILITGDILNGNNLNEDFYYNLTSREVKQFKNAKITLCDVEQL